jgi:hypothetical protein
VKAFDNTEELGGWSKALRPGGFLARISLTSDGEKLKQNLEFCGGFCSRYSFRRHKIESERKPDGFRAPFSNQSPSKEVLSTKNLNNTYQI